MWILLLTTILNSEPIVTTKVFRSRNACYAALELEKSDSTAVSCIKAPSEAIAKSFGIQSEVSK